MYFATLASDLRFGSQVVQINHSYPNEKTLTYLRSSPHALQNSFRYTMASWLTERSIQPSLSFCDYRFRNKGDRNWPGNFITKFWTPRINFEKNATSQISISFHLISQAFKRELKTKEPVIMSTLETVRIFVTEQPLEGLEKLYQEPRGNWMWNCNNILIEGSVVTETHPFLLPGSG